MLFGNKLIRVIFLILFIFYTPLLWSKQFGCDSYPTLATLSEYMRSIDQAIQESTRVRKVLLGKVEEILPKLAEEKSKVQELDKDLALVRKSIATVRREINNFQITTVILKKYLEECLTCLTFNEIFDKFDRILVDDERDELLVLKGFLLSREDLLAIEKERIINFLNTLLAGLSLEELNQDLAYLIEGEALKKSGLNLHLTRKRQLQEEYNRYNKDLKENIDKTKNYKKLLAKVMSDISDGATREGICSKGGMLY